MTAGIRIGSSITVLLSDSRLAARRQTQERYVAALFDEGIVSVIGMTFIGSRAQPQHVYAVGDVDLRYEDEGRTWVRGHENSEAYRAMLAAAVLAESA